MYAKYNLHLNFFRTYGAVSQKLFSYFNKHVFKEKYKSHQDQ